jgi:hypothetical protein
MEAEFAKQRKEAEIYHDWYIRRNTSQYNTAVVTEGVQRELAAYDNWRRQCAETAQVIVDRIPDAEAVRLDKLLTERKALAAAELAAAQNNGAYTVITSDADYDNWRRRNDIARLSNTELERVANRKEGAVTNLAVVAESARARQILAERAALRTEASNKVVRDQLKKKEDEHTAAAPAADCGAFRTVPPPAYRPLCVNCHMRTAAWRVMCRLCCEDIDDDLICSGQPYAQDDLSPFSRKPIERTFPIADVRLRDGRVLHAHDECGYTISPHAAPDVVKVQAQVATKPLPQCMAKAAESVAMRKPIVTIVQPAPEANPVEEKKYPPGGRPCHKNKRVKR